MTHDLIAIILMLFRIVHMNHVTHKTFCVSAFLRNRTIKQVRYLLYLLKRLIAIKKQQHMYMRLFLRLIRIQICVMQR